MKKFWNALDLFIVWCGGVLSGCLTGYMITNLSTMTATLWIWYAAGMIIGIGGAVLTGYELVSNPKEIKA